MKNYYVYQYLREDGTPYYIGKGKNNRAYINNRLIPKPTSKDRIVLIKENLSEQEAFELETKLILYYGRKDLGTGILRNLTNGGEGVSGRIDSVETIQKRVAKNFGKRRTKEQKERMRLAQLSRKTKTEEEKRIIAEKISKNRKGKGTGAKSQEHKLKLSCINKGKTVGPRSEETKQKMRKPKSEAHRRAISEGRRAKYAELKKSQSQ